jgi:hypothetical protein
MVGPSIRSLTECSSRPRYRAAPELKALAYLYGFAADLGEVTSPTGYPQELFNITFLGFNKINQLVEVF